MSKTIKFDWKDMERVFDLIFDRDISGVFLGDDTFAFTERQVEEFEKAGIYFTEIKPVEVRSGKTAG